MQGPQGGTNWQQTSYNPETGYLYICAMRSVSGYTRSGDQLPEGKQGQVADLGSVFTTTGFGTQTGYFGAWDPRTGKTVWQKRWPESCYSGTVTTGGGLVLVGRNGGQLEAYNAESGERLWELPDGRRCKLDRQRLRARGHPVPGVPRLGERPRGEPARRQPLAVLARWDAGPGEDGAGEGTGHAGESPAVGNAQAGEQVFADNCSGCHGLNGTGANGGPTLVRANDRAAVLEQVRNGGGGMPAFEGTLSDKEIRDVAAYVTEEIAQGG